MGITRIEKEGTDNMRRRKGKPIVGRKGEEEEGDQQQK
jgi:hypothetical protein